MSSCDDLVGIGAPGEGFRLGLVVLLDKAVDCGLQVDERMEHAVLQAPPGQLGEEPFHRVQPRA